MIPTSDTAKPPGALPFWLSLSFLPLLYISALYGGWTLALLPLYGWGAISVIDAFAGLNLDNADPETPERDLFWYRLITLIWFPIELVAIYGTILWATTTGHLSGGEKMWLFFGVGMVSGTIGINYAHELMHQKNRTERWLGDLLMALVLYSHFRSEHLLVHHSWVGTVRDPVTARYNEGFHRFFPRVLRACHRSAFRAEKVKLAKRGLPWYDRSNPYWRYWALQAGFLLLALLVGGWEGLGLFLWQAFIAVWQLEMVNYVEHYGLTRKHLGEGRYEHVRPRHSWNAAQKVSNWLLINLQRHSDHHYKPDRRFALLQNHDAASAPQLPFGYPPMTAMAMVPPLFKRVMNPRVRKWRAMYYPEVTDWKPYNKAKNPMPRGAS